MGYDQFQQFHQPFGGLLIISKCPKQPGLNSDRGDTGGGGVSGNCLAAQGSDLELSDLVPQFPSLWPCCTK